MDAQQAETGLGGNPATTFGNPKTRKSVLLHVQQFVRQIQVTRRVRADAAGQESLRQVPQPGAPEGVNER